MTTVTIFEADDLVIKVPITFEAGSLITSLVGATVEAFAKRSGGAMIAGATSVAGAVVTVTFPEFTFIPGVYTLQVVVTSSGQTQTVAEAAMTVHGSLKPAP